MWTDQIINKSLYFWNVVVDEAVSNQSGWREKKREGDREEIRIRPRKIDKLG